MALPVKNLRCLRDPNFERHEWHAGHLSKLPPEDPRKVYAGKQLRKSRGSRVWRMICEWEKNWGAKITDDQRYMLYVFVMTQLSSEPAWETELIVTAGLRINTFSLFVD